jgi:hypothetical protein
MSVFVRAFEQCFQLHLSDISYEDQLQARTGIPRSQMLLTQCSKPVHNIDPAFTLEVSLRVVGGKGGFGALLRGQGMIVRVDNFEACRDLNGRRVRHLNNEIRLKEWRQKKEEEAKFVAEHLEKGEDSQKPLRTKRRADDAYLEDVEESMSAVKLALQQARKRRKQKEEEGSNEPGSLSA